MNFHEWTSFLDKENDKIEKSLNFNLFEGVVIDKRNKKISYNPKHQNNSDTSINNNPSYHKVHGIDVISLFKRKKNIDQSEGNPLVFALKKHNNWKIDIKDIILILKQFVAITDKIKPEYDTIIKVPSRSELNNSFLYRLSDVIDFTHMIDDMFMKLESHEVLTCNDFSNVTKKDWKKLHKSFGDMVDKNDGIFSYKFVPSYLRKYIASTCKDSYIGNELAVSPKINNKDILVLDDTNSTGQIISEICSTIIETYAPKSITVITLFSPL